MNRKFVFRQMAQTGKNVFKRLILVKCVFKSSSYVVADKRDERIDEQQYEFIVINDIINFSISIRAIASYLSLISLASFMSFHTPTFLIFRKVRLPTLVLKLFLLPS